MKCFLLGGEGGDNDIASYYANLYGCQIGTLPLRYLGVPVSFASIKNKDWEFLNTKFLKRLEAWKGYTLSMGGKTILLNACLSSLPYYHMSMFLFNKTFIEKLDKHRRRFLWQGTGDKKKYHLVKWSRVCRSRNKGGLGINDLRKQNISLLCKWWWNLDYRSRLMANYC